MRILGIDPGLRICGYALVDTRDASDILVEAGLFRPRPGRPIAEKLKYIAQDMKDILERLQPRMVAVEELYSHYSHPRTAILMAHARGVILLQCVQAVVEVKSFSATRIKKSLTGNGRASKLQIQRTIQTILGMNKPPEPSDVADAIAAALCCANALRSESKP